MGHPRRIRPRTHGAARVLVPALMVVHLGLWEGGRRPVGGSVVTSTTPVDSALVRRDAQRMVESFVWLWRLYWEAGATLRGNAHGSILKANDTTMDAGAGLQSGGPGVEILRGVGGRGSASDVSRKEFLHCHPDLTAGSPRLAASIIRSGDGKRAICPSWVRTAGGGAGEGAPDETMNLDAWMAPSMVAALRQERLRVIDSLSASAAAIPGDGWITGQRVRFAVDQGDSARALSAARSCRVDPAWCLALVGYARYAAGDVAGADSAFERAVSGFPKAVRCAWTDLSALLDPMASARYLRTPCANRDSLNARIWWLADPLYSEPGNERRVEHYARLVMVELRSAVNTNERWDLRLGEGGRAVREMLVRYGWPSQSYWMGSGEDLSHYKYLAITDPVIQSGGIFAAPEYSINRVHAFPAWHAVMEPWSAVAADWTPAIPGGRTAVDFAWWPEEHFERRGGPIVELDDQTGVFRRDQEILVATASYIGPEALHMASGAPIAGAFVASRSPGMVQVEAKTVAVGVTATARALVAPGRQIVGVEYTSPGRRPVTARARVGIDPPPPLSAMGRRDLAISRPVILRAGPAGETPPTDPELALARMFGSTTFGAIGRVGVYWETYGVGPTDTISLSVRVDPRGDQGRVRQLTTRLTGGPRGVTVSWSEPSAGHIVTTVSGLVPIQARNVNLDLPPLDPGNYVLTVSVSRPRGASVTASRDFVVGPR